MMLLVMQQVELWNWHEAVKERGRGCWIYPWFDHLKNPQCKCIQSTPGCSILIEKASGEPQNESVHTTSEITDYYFMQTFPEFP